MTNEKRNPKIGWGVFKMDCYGLSEMQMRELLIETFEVYEDARRFAAQYPHSAIHWTHLVKQKNVGKNV